MKDQLHAARSSAEAWYIEKSVLYVRVFISFHFIFTIDYCRRRFAKCMRRNESLGAAKDEVRRLREIEAASISARALQLQHASDIEDMRSIQIKLELQLKQTHHDVAKLSDDLKGAQELERAASDRAVAEAASAGLMKLREDQAISELAVVTRKVRIWLMMFCYYSLTWRRLLGFKVHASDCSLNACAAVGRHGRR